MDLPKTPKEFKEFQAYVRKAIRYSDGEDLELGELAFKDSIEMADIDDYTAPEVYTRGQSIQSGDGVATEFTIAHGQDIQPSMWLVTPASEDASGTFHVEADGTNLIVKYTSAPVSGTDNIKLNWIAYAGIAP